MRSAAHILIGAVAGFALGILTPIALAAIMLWFDPDGMKQGGATPFAILIILTAPGGAIAGAIWGATSFHFTGPIIKKGSQTEIGKFEEQFGGFSIDEQRAALAEILPVWLNDYRKTMYIRIWATIALLLLSVAPFMLLLLAAYSYRTVRIIMDMRAGLEAIRARWGDEVVDQLGPLPYTLRPAH